MTGLHRGFASLTFWDPDSAASAMQERPHIIDGDRVGILRSFSVRFKSAIPQLPETCL